MHEFPAARASIRSGRPGLKLYRLATDLGLGAIGSRVASYGKAFGMRVLGIRLSTEAVANVDRQATLADFDAFLPEADFLVLVIPVTPEAVGPERSGRPGADEAHRHADQRRTWGPGRHSSAQTVAPGRAPPSLLYGCAANRALAAR